MRFSYLPWMSETAGPGLAAPPEGSRPPCLWRACGGSSEERGPSRGSPRPLRAARTHPCALRQVVPAERVVQVEAHHVALSQGKVPLHRRAAVAASGRRRRKRREEEGARAALPAEPCRQNRAGPAGLPRPAPPRPAGAALTCGTAPRRAGDERRAGQGRWPEACQSARIRKTRFPPRLCALGSRRGNGAFPLVCQTANESYRGCLLGGPGEQGAGGERESALVSDRASGDTPQGPYRGQLAYVGRKTLLNISLCTLSSLR